GGGEAGEAAGVEGRTPKVRVLRFALGRRRGRGWQDAREGLPDRLLPGREGRLGLDPLRGRSLRLLARPRAGIDDRGLARFLLLQVLPRDPPGGVPGEDRVPQGREGDRAGDEEGVGKRFGAAADRDEQV